MEMEMNTKMRVSTQPFRIPFGVVPNNLARVELHICWLIIGAVVDNGAAYSVMDTRLVKEMNRDGHHLPTRDAPDCSATQSATGHQQKIARNVALPTK
jgi:hypothetical protein